MAMMTYPLNFIDYSASDAETWLATRSSGVFAANDFAYSVTGADTEIKIGTGLAWIHNHRFAGKAFKNDSDYTLTLDISDGSLPRIDVVAIRFDKERNKTSIIVKKGTARSSPVIPAITQTESVYELYLYKVLRPAGSVYVTASNITDLRLSEYCGLMADSVTKVDTTAINAQINALISELEKKIEQVRTGTDLMLKSAYDTNGDGVVDNSQKLEGHTADYFMPKAGGTFTGNAKAATIAGNLAGVRNMAFYDSNGTVTTDNIVFIKCYDK